MSRIEDSMKGLEEPDKGIGLLLMAFYEGMQNLEKDENRGGMQATFIIMTMNDMKNIMDKYIESKK